jgi:hypothetical protein
VSLENAYMETSSAIAGIVRVLNIDYHKAGLEKNPGFKKKIQPSGFFWVFWAFLGVFSGFFLYICPEERVFRVFFSFKNTLI